MARPSEPLFVAERKEQILQLLKEQTKIFVPDLCERFNVSPVTIRNDLRELEAAGRLRRTHGGAISIERETGEMSLSSFSIPNLEAKRRIAQKAAELVRDGDVIAMDFGTTVLEFARCLIKKKELSIVTNDLRVALQLEATMPDAKIVREIFEMRADGKSLGAISDWLYEQGVFSPTGKRRWSRETISKLLKNEKYVGDVLLQKTFVKDLFSGKQVKNVGERERFLYQDHHPAIISRELFDKVNR